MKKESSRAYISSHIILRNNVFGHSKDFYNNLISGPANMKQYLYDIWNNITPETINSDFELSDIDRKVTKDEFDVGYKIINNTYVFFIGFPDPDSYHAQAKCVALILGKDMPRYITMEIARPNGTEDNFMVCEWCIKDNGFVHNNYGRMHGNCINDFIARVTELFFPPQTGQNTSN